MVRYYYRGIIVWGRIRVTIIIRVRIRASVRVRMVLRDSGRGRVRGVGISDKIAS